MKKLIAVLALAALSFPTDAFAGFGMTAYQLGTSSGAAGWVPSLDWRQSGFLVQVHGLDLIGGLANKQTAFGADITGIVKKKKVSGNAEGVAMLGGAFGILKIQNVDATNFDLYAKMRLGAEMKEGMGFGIYVVPLLGLSNRTAVSASGDPTVGLAYGGGIEISAWFQK